MSDVKQAFTSRFKNGHIVEVDWNQLEVVILANLAQEKNLANALNNGLDLHSVSAAAMGGMEYNEFIDELATGSSTCKLARKNAKAATFALQYGAGEQRIMEITGWDRGIAQDFMKTYYELYPNLLPYYSSVMKEVWSTTKPVNKNGEVWYYGQYKGPQGRRWVFSTNQTRAWDDKPKYSQTQMRNYPIQGTASDFVTYMLNKLLILLDNKNVLLVNTIHDSVVFDVKSGYLPELESDIRNIYRNAKYFMNDLFKGKLDILVAPSYTVKEGSNWSVT